MHQLIIRILISVHPYTVLYLRGCILKALTSPKSFVLAMLAPWSNFLIMQIWVMNIPVHAICTWTRIFWVKTLEAFTVPVITQNKLGRLSSPEAASSYPTEKSSSDQTHYTVQYMCHNTIVTHTREGMLEYCTWVLHSI